MRYFDERKGRVEIIPMIDIMLFLLVVFMMVTFRMIPASGIGSQLPSSETAKIMPRPSVVVSLLADGSVRVHGQVMTPPELAQWLKGRDPAKTTVTIAGAKNATVQMMLRVLDACREAGMTHIGIAARPVGAANNAG
ncbi:MAG: biopolymer transporter ExbD [Gammaproteobacteria bacterium]|jgi:biopolymer transport protein ExbD